MTKAEQENQDLPRLAAYTCNRLPESTRCHLKQKRGACPGKGKKCLSTQSAEFAVVRRTLAREMALQ